MSNLKANPDASYSVEVYELRVWRTGLKKMVGQRTVLPWPKNGKACKAVGEDRL